MVTHEVHTDQCPGWQTMVKRDNGVWNAYINFTTTGKICSGKLACQRKCEKLDTCKIQWLQSKFTEGQGQVCSNLWLFMVQGNNCTIWKEYINGVDARCPTVPANQLHW